MEEPGRFIEDIVVTLPGEVKVTSPKEVESDLSVGENRDSDNGGGTGSGNGGALVGGARCSGNAGPAGGDRGSGNGGAAGIYNTNAMGKVVGLGMEGTRCLLSWWVHDAGN